MPKLRVFSITPRMFSIILYMLLVCMPALQAPCVSAAEPWTGNYGRNGEIRVDPRTNRATINRNGVQSQLWDGVHTLDDGSTLTVRSGQAVPNREILDSREPRPPRPPEDTDWRYSDMWAGAPIYGRSPCEILVRRVCGAAHACAEEEACSIARQLLDFENEERAASRMPDRMTRASGECQEAEYDDAYFATCTRRNK